MFNFTPIRITNHLEKGCYEGSISRVDFNENKGYFIIEIVVDRNTVFSTAFSTKNMIFNNLACYFLTEDGMLDENEMLHSVVKFNVVDNVTENSIKSRVTSIVPVFEE